jgi:hypothetical protein
MGDQLGIFNSSSVGTAAVQATATGPSGTAVWATSKSGTGVLAISALAGSDPVEGTLTPGGSGVIGENGQPFGIGVTGIAVGSDGIGVQGVAQDGTAVQGTATTGIALSASSISGIALSVDSGGSFGAPQVTITQDTQDDFARIRMGPFNTFPGTTNTSPGAWDIASGGPDGVLNFYSIASATNVISASSNGNVTISGSLHQHSSRALKENICDLTFDDAVQALMGLSPVQYQLRGDHSQSKHLGFIAEDMPDLIATSDRKTVCQMDILAVLTKIVHRLRSDNLQLIRRIEVLEHS